jgi:CHAT domain-containing protein
LLLLLIPLEDSRPGSAAVIYDHARKLFERGRLADCQREAEEGLKQFQISSPEWTVKFQLLGAETMIWRGMYNDAEQLIARFSPANNPEWTVRKLTLESMILAHQDQLSLANRDLAEALDLCRAVNYQACGDAFQAGGILATRQGNLPIARRYILDSLALAQAHQDRFLAANASMNLGWTELQFDHFDEAADWSRTAYQAAVELDAEDLAQTALGNLGWAYYKLGDGERALEEFLEAEKSAEKLGDLDDELNWISTAGHVYRDAGDHARATESYRRALALANQIDSKEDIIDALEDLAQVSVDSGDLDQASAYIAQVAPMELAGGNRLSANVLLTQGMLAAARHQDAQAESLLRSVRGEARKSTTTRLGAGEQLARLYEREGDIEGAEQMYQATLNDFEFARAELKSEESSLPFVANAARIYDGYIHLLVTQGRSDQALAVADRSRARTLAQALSVTGGKAIVSAAPLDSRRVAQKTGATLLFYWLGRQQSYLWAITPAKTAFFLLPAQAEIVAHVGRYRKAVLDFEDPVRTGNPDGRALYEILVSPAAKLIRPGSPVMILADGELSKLNFETLLAPGPSPELDLGSDPAPQLHYWIDDATVLAAPSLAMLAAAMPAPRAERSLLLLGDPVSPNQDFPSLPLFGFEMKTIQRQFDPGDVAVFASQRATPAAYLASNPAQFSYIHFVSHAVASSTDPLDSAIILSASTDGEDSFKLYARDIMQHPIGARLVTISSCYGSGTRSYAGEGLVGLSWAFLRAGAHSVIGALWEVSDDSSPRLMNTLYQGLNEGESPAAALRRGKLALLHRENRFRAPFYWAPFQIYTR